MQGYNEISLKINFIGLEKFLFCVKSTWILLYSFPLNRDQDQYEIVLPLFGAAFAAPNKGNANWYLFISLFSIQHFQSWIIKCKSNSLL